MEKCHGVKGHHPAGCHAGWQTRHGRQGFVLPNMSQVSLVWASRTMETFVPTELPGSLALYHRLGWGVRTRRLGSFVAWASHHPVIWYEYLVCAFQVGLNADQRTSIGACASLRHSLYAREPGSSSVQARSKSGQCWMPSCWLTWW